MTDMTRRAALATGTGALFAPALPAFADARRSALGAPAHPFPPRQSRSSHAMPQTSLSAVRLDRLEALLARHVSSGDLPGCVALVHRRGETRVAVLGSQSVAGSSMRRDTIFRIASLTKPVTAALAMMLVEDGVLRLDDPVDPLLPELASRRVLRSLDADLDDTVPANRSITLRDLLTMRMGLGAIMVWPAVHPIQFAMEESGVAPGWQLFDGPPEEYMRRLGALPLVYQPGEGWLYDTGMHVAGILMERATGSRLDVLMRDRLFEPLGMADTGFHVPPDRLERLAGFYSRDFASGRLEEVEPAGGGRFAAPPAFHSGSGGLVSTADDNLAFCRMLLAGGMHEGRRLLSRPSVMLMTSDQLTQAQRHAAAIFLEGHSGWGFGMAVGLARAGIELSPGRFGWNGGYGTSAYTDPAEGLIGILMTQRMMDSPLAPAHFRDFWTGAYAAIAD